MLPFCRWWDGGCPLGAASFCFSYSPGFQEETCMCVFAKTRRMLSTEQCLFFVSACRWPAARLCADMMTASKAADVSSKTESSVCKSTERWELSMSQRQGTSLSFVIPKRKKTRRKHSFCSALSLSPHRLSHAVVCLNWFHCHFRAVMLWFLASCQSNNVLDS